MEFALIHCGTVNYLRLDKLFSRVLRPFEPLQLCGEAALIFTVFPRPPFCA
jgi:hypothetical protein